MLKSRYFSGILMSLAVLSLSGCTDKGGGSDQPTGPSVRTSAHIQFVSRLSDATLYSSASEASQVGDYVNGLLSEGGTVAILDRTDMNGVAYAADMLVDSKKFSSFVVLGQNGTEDFDVSTIVFNAPSDLVSGFEIENGCYASGLKVEIDGTVTNYDENGNVTKANAVKATVPLFSCRFDTESQVNAFASSTLAAMKTYDRQCVILGTVRNSLLTGLQSAVTAADSGYAVAEVTAGSDYTVFMLYATRYWGFNGVEETSVAGGITSYAVDIAWK